MTARTMLLTDEEMIRESYGRHMVRHLYEAERNRLLDEIERLKASLAQWEAFRKGNPFLSAWDGEDDPTIPLPEKHEEKGSDHE